MRRRQAAPVVRLIPLTALVLAAHLVVLTGSWKTLTPGREPNVQRFETRIIALAPPAPTAPPAASQPAAAPIPSPAAAPGKRTAPAAPQSAASPPAEPAPATAAALPVQPEPSQWAGAPQPERGVGSLPGGTVTAFVPGVIAVPEPAKVHYEVTVASRGLTVEGTARLDWWHDGQHYEARMEVRAAGLAARTQRSAGRITDHGLAPEVFSDKSRGEQATHFDRTQDRVVFSNNRPQAALVPGMQDRLSVLVQLSVLIAGEPQRFAPGTRIALPTATTREAEDWIFSVEGEEDLELPGGALRALKLQRLPRREFDQKVELWLAPRMDYAPVRVRLTNPDGGWVDHRWSSTDRG